MRLATFNILHGRSTSDAWVDVDRFARAVRELDPDVLALQEVDRHQPRSGGADLTAAAAEAMDAADHRFAAALHGTPGEAWAAAEDERPDSPAYGIALLSRYPVAAWQVLRLPPVPMTVPVVRGGRPVLVRDEPRVAAVATVRTPYGELEIVNTHLSFIRWWNGRQLHTLMRGVEGNPRPMVLMGDLNMGPTRAAVLSGMRPLASHLTFPAHRPRVQLDHVLLDGDLPHSADPSLSAPFPRRVGPRVTGRPEAGSAGRGLDSRAVELPLSDHRALVVDL